MDLYPLQEKHADVIKSKSGKKLDEFTIEHVLSDKISSEDIKISKEVLFLQAEVARQQGKIQMAKNFIRAAELVDVPDDEILRIYNLMRPYRATEMDFLETAQKLKFKYNAPICSDFIMETLEIYQKRDLLLSEK